MHSMTSWMLLSMQKTWLLYLCWWCRSLSLHPVSLIHPNLLACLWHHIKLAEPVPYNTIVSGLHRVSLGAALTKPPKIFKAQTPFFVNVQGIYDDKIHPMFTKKIPRSAPLGASTKNFAYFVSDWTGDSHLTHYLTSKMMSFWYIPKL